MDLQPQWAQAFSLLKFRCHNQTYHTWWDFSGQMIGPSQRTLTHISKRSQETSNLSPGAIRNRNPSNREAANPHLRPHGRRYRLTRYKVQGAVFNTEGLLGKDCWRGKAICVNRNECACRYSHVTYLACKKHVPYYIVYLTAQFFFHVISQTARIMGEKNY